MPHAEINGAQIYYELHGEGSPPGAVPRWLGGHGPLGPNIGPLSRRWRVVVGDRRGCGRSSDPGEGHSRRIWRDDLLGLLAHLDNPDLCNRTVEEFLPEVEGLA